MKDHKRLLLLLLPGLDGTGRLFSTFVEALPETIEPQIISLPREGGAGYEDLVACVREHLPSHRPFALLGESFSGPLAIRLAAEQPASLVALILVASFHRKPVVRWLAGLRRLAPLALSRPPPTWATRRLLAGDDAPSELATTFRNAVRENAPSVLGARVRAALDEDATEAFAACRVPILYLGGARDRLLRRTIPSELKRLQPALEVQLLDAPHLVLQRRPVAAARIVSRFLARIPIEPDR